MAKPRSSSALTAALLVVLLAVTLSAMANDASPPPCSSADLGQGEPCVGVLGHPQEKDHPGIGVAACCDALDRLGSSCNLTCGFLDGLETDFLLELGKSTDQTCISVRKKKEALCK